MNDGLREKDEIVMKLLHYFITEEKYNPIVLHGAKDEIWLENMDNNYKIVRIVSNYIHNDDQLEFDLFRTKRIAKNIKQKTFNINMDILSIFVDLGENVKLKDDDHISCVFLKTQEDLTKYQFLYDYFPEINKKLTFTEKGVDLFVKITEDINKKNKEEAKKTEEIFTPKKPIVTSIIIAINIIIFALGIVFFNHDNILNRFGLYGPFVRSGDYYRMITAIFLHLDFIHLFVNMYSLWNIGSQVESFFGKTKFLLIYLFSGLMGSLLSMLFNINTGSVGASGAIFGLIGAIAYFGYNYRVYFGNTILKQIMPTIVLNLMIGFMLTGIDNYAHIGGLIGGFLMAAILGLKHKNKKSDQINAVIISIILILFLVFMNFFYVK